MSTPAMSPDFLTGSHPTRRQFYAVLVAAGLLIGPFLLWPRLAERLLATNFLPHLYCYLGNPSVVWMHVVSDTLIGIAYFSISVTLAYLVHKGRRNIPFHWILLAFGVFIIACGATHFMEVVTIWIPVYIFSAVVKGFTAAASLTTAAVLPFTIPQILLLIQRAKESEQATVSLRASEERKEALLREVHHRVKNNLAVICSLLYLQSTHTRDQQAIQIFRDMEDRVHSMALVHESLYRSENLARINFAEYAQVLTKDILSSHGSPDVPVRLKSSMEPVIMSADLAVPCGLILNELVSNAFKHGFPNGAKGEINVTLRRGPEHRCTLSVEDNGVGIPADLDINTSNSLGLRLVRSLTQQIHGAFQLVKSDLGTSAQLLFTEENNAR